MFVPPDADVTTSSNLYFSPEDLPVAGPVPSVTGENIGLFGFSCGKPRRPECFISPSFEGGPDSAPARNLAALARGARASADGRRGRVPPSRGGRAAWWRGRRFRRGSGRWPSRPSARCMRRFPSVVQLPPRRPHMSAADPCRPGQSDVAAAVERELKLSAGRLRHPFGQSHRPSRDGEGRGRVRRHPVAG